MTSFIDVTQSHKYIFDRRASGYEPKIILFSTREKKVYFSNGMRNMPKTFIHSILIVKIIIVTVLSLFGRIYFFLNYYFTCLNIIPNLTLKKKKRMTINQEYLSYLTLSIIKLKIRIQSNLKLPFHNVQYDTIYYIIFTRVVLN